MADQQTPTEAYSQLDQAQRTQLAQQFMQRLREEHSSHVKQFEHIDLNTITAAQLAEIHDAAAQNHPAILNDVMNHPVITAALAGFAAYQLDKHLRNRG